MARSRRGDVREKLEADSPLWLSSNERGKKIIAIRPMSVWAKKKDEEDIKREIKKN